MEAEVQSTKGYLDMELLRFTTAGSVDDGKSTLIGRLLYDSKSIFEDQYEAIEETSRRKAGAAEGVEKGQAAVGSLSTKVGGECVSGVDGFRGFIHRYFSG